MPKQNCKECQFEKGNHSFECSKYKEPDLSMLKQQEWDLKKDLIAIRNGAFITPILKRIQTEIDKAEKIGWAKGCGTGYEVFKKARIELIKKMETEINIDGIHSTGFCNQCNQCLCKCPERDKGGVWIKLPSNAQELIDKLKSYLKQIK